MAMNRMWSKRGLFQYSPREYLTNTKNSMLAQKVRKNKLVYQTLDDAEINVNLYGYPF